MTTKQSPIVPVRVKPDMKEQFLLAAEHVNELAEHKAFLIKKNELPY